MINSWKSLNCFAKTFISDAWQVSELTSGNKWMWHQQCTWFRHVHGLLYCPKHKYFSVKPIMTGVHNMVRHTLKILQKMLQHCKKCLTILWLHGITGLKYIPPHKYHYILGCYTKLLHCLKHKQAPALIKIIWNF